MSQQWYLMAFGVELGPMSWDDLRERASRGDLRPDSQVRRGDAGAFVQAADVPGLLGPAVDEPRETSWFCEVLGSELGPMSWKELCSLAERGTLRGSERVRSREGAWVPASSVAGLVRSAAASPDRSEPPTVAAAPPTKVSEAASPAPPKAVASSAPPPSEPRRPEQATEKKPAPVAPSPTAQPPVAHPPTLSPPPPAPPKKTKKTARAGEARPRVSVQLPGKSLAVLAGVVLIACGGYFAWAYLPARSVRPDYRQVVALYRQAHEQIKQFRSNPQNQSPSGLQFQFSRVVTALRKQLEPLSGDSSAGQLVEAGTQLTQMLADCQAAGGSAEATRFADSEQRFLAILNSFQGQP